MMFWSSVKTAVVAAGVAGILLGTGTVVAQRVTGASPSARAVSGPGATDLGSLVRLRRDGNLLVGEWVSPTNPAGLGRFETANPRLSWTATGVRGERIPGTFELYGTNHSERAGSGIFHFKLRANGSNFWVMVMYGAKSPVACIEYIQGHDRLRLIRTVWTADGRLDPGRRLDITTGPDIEELKSKAPEALRNDLAPVLAMVTPEDLLGPWAAPTRRGGEGQVEAATTNGNRMYLVDVRVTPGAVTNQYVAEFRVSRRADGTNALMSSPKIVVNAGQEGQMEVVDEGAKNGVICSVLVKESEEGVEAKTRTTIRAGGRDVWESAQALTIPSPAWKTAAASVASSYSLLHATAAARETARRTRCLNNLRQIGLCCTMYAMDNNEHFPPSLKSIAEKYGTDPKLYVCPATDRQPGDLATTVTGTAGRAPSWGRPHLRPAPARAGTS